MEGPQWFNEKFDYEEAQKEKVKMKIDLYKQNENKPEILVPVVMASEKQCFLLHLENVGMISNANEISIT